MWIVIGIVVILLVVLAFALGNPDPNDPKYADRAGLRRDD